MKLDPVSVSEFQALVNQTLEFAYSEIVVEGEVASYKVNQGKWVFFDLKDDSCVVSCFIPIFQLKQKLEDGMLVRVGAVPQLTKWGKFSLNVKTVELAGEGTVKRAFELLKAQFEQEGLFAPERKRLLPQFPERVALITSRQAAAFNDFVTILDDRWQGLQVDHWQVQVQGADAPSQIAKAIAAVNAASEGYDALVIIRGGGSAEDLEAFSTEEVVRAVYGSHIPTLVGIGHEDDVSLAELAADVRAATPTDAARRLVPDSAQVRQNIQALAASQKSSVERRFERITVAISRFEHAMSLRLQALHHRLTQTSERLEKAVHDQLAQTTNHLSQLKRLIHTLDPQAVLARGYSITRLQGKVIRSSAQVPSGSELMVQLHQGSLKLYTNQPRKSAHARIQKSQTDQTQLQL